MTTTKPFLPALLLLLSASASLPAAQEAARSEIEFARGLARDWQMVDLAEEVILEIEREGASSELAGELALVKCEIFAEGAKNEGDADRREELYTKAIEAYRSYLEQNPYSDLLPQAERDYVDVATRYAMELSRRHEEAVGEEAEALRERIHEVLDDPIKLTGEIIASLEASPDPSVKELMELYRTMYNRGRLLHVIARSSDEGAFFFAQAEKVLENLAMKAGDTTPQGLFAYLELAKTKASQGEFRTSTDFSMYVVDQVVPIDATRRHEALQDLTPEEKQRRWVFAEWGTPPLVDALLRAGDSEEAIRWGLHFYNTWKREGFNLSRPSGYQALLEVTRALLSSGGYVGGSVTTGNLAWFSTQAEMEQGGFRSRRDQRSALDLALSIAQTVNQENRGNTLQILAQKLISDAIERPGVQVSPSVLFEAAQGVYYNRDYSAAIDAFKRVLSALQAQDEATQAEFGARVLYHIGESHRRLDRLMEAAMAYREGATTWRGDPEYDERNARGYYGTISELRNAGLAGVEEFDSMWREAESLVAGIASDPGEIVFRQAKRLYDRNDFTAARERFLEVKPTADSYEKALTYAALCLYKTKDLSGGEEEFERYLNEFVPDPKNAITKPQKIAARKEARAQATFYLGIIAYERANRNEEPFSLVVERLGEFDERFPNQTSYAPNALYMVLMSHLAQNEVAEARKVLDHMVEVFPDQRITGTAALKVYKVLDAEREKVVAAGDGAKAREMTEQMAQAMELSNSLDDSPGFGNLRVESKLWMQLEEWKRAESVLRRILERFGESAEYENEIARFVKPDLGRTLLAQREVQEAYEVLDSLVPTVEEAATDPRKPSREVVRDFARSVTGWTEWRDGKIVEVSGVGGAERFEKALPLLTQLADAVGRDAKWECPWYEAKLDVAYGYYKWGDVASERLASARSTIADLRQLLQDPLLNAVEESCGSDELKKSFLWLWDRVQ